jgi:phosphoribosylformylglycinamidine synthase
MADSPTYSYQEHSAAVSATDWQEAMENVLRAKPCHSKVYHRYDQHIGLRTVLGPEHQGAAVIWAQSDWTSNPDVGVTVSAACEEDLTAEDANLGTQYAVLKAARMIYATGGVPLAITDCMNFGNPEDPVIMRQFSDSVDGMSVACKELNTPVIGGNVSLYNQSNKTSIHPTPMIGTVGKINDVKKAIPAALAIRTQDDQPSKLRVFWLGPKKQNFAWVGSVYARTAGIGAHDLLPVDYHYEKQAAGFIASWNEASGLAACRDIGSSGNLATVLKSLECSPNYKDQLVTPAAFAGSDKTDTASFWLARNQGYLAFSQDPASVSVPETMELLEIGSIDSSDKGELSLDGQALDMIKLKKAWKGGLQ